MMNFLVDDIGAVVARMRPIDDSYDAAMIAHLDSIQATAANRLLMPFYMYGHRLEIANRIEKKKSDKVFEKQRYPLIALRMDFEEQVSQGLWHYTLNLAIINYTDKNWNAEQRMTNIFKPVLYPLYERFLQEIRNSGLFFWPGNQYYPEHTKIDRPFWGTESQEGNVKNIFNDPIDAIEIIGLKLNQRIKDLNC